METSTKRITEYWTDSNGKKHKFYTWVKTTKK